MKQAATRASAGGSRGAEWLTYLLGAIFALNVLDALATVFWVSSGLAYEANPLMAELLQVHPGLFALGKLTLVGLGLSLLWRHRDHLLSALSTVVLTVVYLGVVLYHLWLTAIFF